MPDMPQQLQVQIAALRRLPGAGSQLADQLEQRWGIQGQANQALGSYQQGSNVNLFDQLSPQTLAMFGQLFNQQRANLGQAQTSAVGQANRSAGAYAASRGYDNPYSFQQRAQGNVYEAFAPQFGQLEAGNLEALLGGTQASNQFKRQGLFGLGGAQFQNAQFQEMIRQFQEQLQNQPGFLENLFSGLIGAGGRIGAAYAGRPG